MAIVYHKSITIPNEKNTIYFIINGEILMRFCDRLKNNNIIVKIWRSVVNDTEV